MSSAASSTVIPVRNRRRSLPMAHHQSWTTTRMAVKDSHRSFQAHASTIVAGAIERRQRRALARVNIDPSRYNIYCRQQRRSHGRRQNFELVYVSVRNIALWLLEYGMLLHDLHVIILLSQLPRSTCHHLVYPAPNIGMVRQGNLRSSAKANDQQYWEKGSSSYCMHKLATHDLLAYRFSPPTIASSPQPLENETAVCRPRYGTTKSSIKEHQATLHSL
jgi:hypothetical protein